MLIVSKINKNIINNSNNKKKIHKSTKNHNADTCRHTDTHTNIYMYASVHVSVCLRECMSLRV